MRPAESEPAIFDCRFPHRLGSWRQREWNAQFPRQCLGNFSATVRVRQVETAHVLKITLGEATAEVGLEVLRRHALGDEVVAGVAYLIMWVLSRKIVSAG